MSKMNRHSYLWKKMKLYMISISITLSLLYIYQTDTVYAETNENKYYSIFILESFKPINFRDTQFYFDENIEADFSSDRNVDSTKYQLDIDNENDFNIIHSLYFNYFINDIQEKYDTFFYFYNGISFRPRIEKTDNQLDNENVSRYTIQKIKRLLNKFPIDITYDKYIYFKKDLFLNFNIDNQFTYDYLYRKYSNNDNDVTDQEFNKTLETENEKEHVIDNTLDFSFSFGKGRRYSAEYYTEAVKIIEELGNSGMIMKTVSTNDMNKLSRIIFEQRQKYYADLRENDIESINRIVDFLFENNYIAPQHKGNASILVSEIWRYRPIYTRSFGSRISLDIGLEYNYNIEINNMDIDLYEEKSTFDTNGIIILTEIDDYTEEVETIINEHDIIGYIGFSYYTPPLIKNRKFQLDMNFNLKLDLIDLFIDMSRVNTKRYDPNANLIIDNSDKKYDMNNYDFIPIINYNNTMDIYYYINYRTFITIIQNAGLLYNPRKSKLNKIYNYLQIGYSLNFKLNRYVTPKLILSASADGELTYTRYFDEQKILNDYSFLKNKKHKFIYNFSITMSLEYYFDIRRRRK